MLLVTTFAVMVFFAWRNVALFAVVAAPVLSRHAASALGRLPPLSRRSRDLPPELARRLNLGLAVGWALVAGILLVRFLQPERLERSALQAMPAAAVRSIQREELPGPLFNSYNWGAYILWSMYPDYRSFVDGRTDLFDDLFLQEYLQAWRGAPGWEALLDDWQDPDGPSRAAGAAGPSLGGGRLGKDVHRQSGRRVHQAGGLSGDAGAGCGAGAVEPGAGGARTATVTPSARPGWLVPLLVGVSLALIVGLTFVNHNSPRPPPVATISSPAGTRPTCG